jgi:P27 family predicted phage terminase small subunit
MARGRRKKLAALSLLEGNPGKRPIAAGVEGLGAPFIPEHLSEDARGCVEVVRTSMPHHIYCALDSFLLAAFATAWAVHKRAAHEIANPGFKFVIDGKCSRVQNPWLRVMNQQAAIMASLGTKLGLDPHARQALALPAHKPESKFAGLLGRESAANFSRKN